MTFGSLFAGIGGIDFGLERAGMRCLWQVEIDNYASRVLARHWPNVTRHQDIRKVGSYNLESVDLIAGGFPCQDISNAGKRIGIDGERSGLWSEFHRLVCEIRPRYVLVENVSALLVRGIQRVLGDLAASGYDAEWDCIPAAAVGAHHRRDRLFIVAYASGVQSERRGKSLELACASGEGEGHQSERQRIWNAAGDCGAALADTNLTRLEIGQVFGSNSREKLEAAFRSNRNNGGVWPTEPDVGRVAHGVPNRVERLRGLGNAVVPQIAEFIGRRIMETAE